MEKIFKIYSENKIKILTATILGILIGSIAGFFTNNTKITGSFYVGRKTQNVDEVTFTYEGYYGQQNALSYTKTVLALLESQDIKFQTLNTLQIKQNVKNLNTLSRKISVKNPGPQIITITIKGANQEETRNIWDSYTNVLLGNIKYLNQKSDPNLSLTPINSEPVVLNYSKPIAIYAISMGLLLGLFTSMALGLIEFLKENK